MMVMVAVSLSLVLTYSFLRTQTVVLQMSQNGIRRNLALQAAQTGASLAVEAIHSPDWSGVETNLTQLVLSDQFGETSFLVEFLPVGEDTRVMPGEVPSLQILIRSTGIWQSHENIRQRTERVVEVIAQLQPRVPDVPPAGDDSGVVSDLAPNPTDYNAIQKYALFADLGGSSLVLDPSGCISGQLWLDDRIDFYSDPHWSDFIRQEYLESLGRRYVDADGPKFPHPLIGNITFHNSPYSFTKDDLQAIKTNWSLASSDLDLPNVEHNSWGSYQLYEGGFTYQAVEISSVLRNVQLLPTPDNPLGIFYRNGNVYVQENVLLRGALISTGMVIFSGSKVHFNAFNWRDSQGESLVTTNTAWPRLPVLVAESVYTYRDAQVSLEGAVIVENGFDGAGGEYELTNAVPIDFTATATGQPTDHACSLLSFDTEPAEFSTLRSNFESYDYALWLPDGNAGTWHPIVAVDDSTPTIQVIGEVDLTTSTTVRVMRNRQYYLDVRGPISGERSNIHRPNVWGGIDSFVWTFLFDAWEGDVEELVENLDSVPEFPPIEFVNWLADPDQFSGWANGLLQTYGLTIEPTFFVHWDARHFYRWSPPLFRPFNSNDVNAEQSGYRWEILSWREMP